MVVMSFSYILRYRNLFYFVIKIRFSKSVEANASTMKLLIISSY